MRSDDLTLFAIIGVVALPVFAVSARVMLRAGADALLRVRQASSPAAAIEPPGQVAALQHEVEELRAQLDRMSATESFYAQLQQPAPPTS